MKEISYVTLKKGHIIFMCSKKSVFSKGYAYFSVLLYIWLLLNVLISQKVSPQILLGTLVYCMPPLIILSLLSVDFAQALYVAFPTCLQS